MDPSSDGVEDNIPPWHVTRRSVCPTTIGILSRGSKDTCLQVEERIIWFEASLQSMVHRIETYLVKLVLTRSNVDPNLYFKVVQEMLFILVLYVDDHY